MYTARVEADFAAAHFLSHYHGKCENLHGHNYRVRLWVRGETLPKGWEPWFINGNDNTIEGIRSTTRPFSAVQFHPEGCPGPRDTEFLIDRFLDQVKQGM